MKITIDCTGLYYSLIQGLVILRDKKCIECGSKNHLHVHHEKGKTDNNPKFLTTLCFVCHTKKHTNDNGKREMTLINKLIKENGISLSKQIAPFLGITQPSITDILTCESKQRLGRLVALKDIVNNILGTSYTVEEMFSTANQKITYNEKRKQKI